MSIKYRLTVLVFFWSLLAANLFCGIAPVMSREIPYEKGITLTETQLTFINIAIKEMDQRGVSIKGYKLEIFRFGNKYRVYFKHPELTEFHRGSPEDKPTFGVLFDADGSVLEFKLIKN